MTTQAEQSDPIKPEQLAGAIDAVDKIVEHAGLLSGQLQVLRERMYHNYHVRRMRLKSRKIVGDLFGAFMDDHRILPDRWRERANAVEGNDVLQARLIADYIAGMTDRYAIKEHKRLFNLYEGHL